LPQSAVTFTLHGFDDLNRRFRGYPPKLKRRAMRVPLTSVTNKTATKLKRGTPRRTGEAQRRVWKRVSVTDTRAFGIVKYRGRRAGIMGMRERGTVRQPGRPFFLAAVAGWQQDAQREFTAGIKAVIERNEG
jgi:HK97 gp10 family phage protein